MEALESMMHRDNITWTTHVGQFSAVLDWIFVEKDKFKVGRRRRRHDW